MIHPDGTVFVVHHFENVRIFNNHYKIFNIQCMCMLPSIHDVAALAETK